MIKYDIANLESLSNNAICSIPYPDEEIKKWKSGDISFLLKSKSPQFIKDILEHKKRKYIIKNKIRKVNKNHKSTRYFGEGYVASILGNYIQKGWYSSFKWLYDPNWITGKNPEQEKDPVIKKLKREFYKNALREYIDLEKLKDLQTFWGTEHPVAPDLWLIDKKNRHYLIEVKKEKDTPDNERRQWLGLTLLERYFKIPVFIVYLHPENQKTLNSNTRSEWLRDYNSVKIDIGRRMNR